MSYIPVLSFSGVLEQDQTWISQSYKLSDTYLSATVAMQVPDVTIGEIQIYVSNDDINYYILNSLIVSTSGADLVSLETNVTGFYMQVRYQNTGAARNISLATKLRQSYVI